ARQGARGSGAREKAAGRDLARLYGLALRLGVERQSAIGRCLARMRRWTAAIPGGRLPTQLRSAAIFCGRGPLGRTQTAPTSVAQIRINASIGYAAISLPMGASASLSYEGGGNWGKATTEPCV